MNLLLALYKFHFIVYVDKLHKTIEIETDEKFACAKLFVNLLNDKLNKYCAQVIGIFLVRYALYLYSLNTIKFICPIQCAANAVL